MKNIVNNALAVLGSLIVSAASPSVNAADVTSLRPFYRYYQVPGTSSDRDFLVAGFPPDVRVIGGGIDPPPVTNSFGTFFSVDRRMLIVSAEFESSFRRRDVTLIIYGAAAGPCDFNGTRLPQSFTVGLHLSTVKTYYRRSPADDCLQDQFGGEPPGWQLTEQVTLQAPVRRKAFDGSEYEASPMVVAIEGVPWMTYYAGYRFGFVAGESNWNNGNLSKTPALATWPTLPNSRDNFELVKLLRPFVEGEVVEYVNEKDFPNSPGGQYFYATSQADQAALDAVPNWWRTSQSFKSGGYVPVCRLYGSAVPGPNTHFYSADDAECKSLRSNSALHYEGQPFRASRLIAATGACPIATIALYRGFNNPSGKGYDPNHRYVTNRDLLTKLKPLGWVDEGAVMCVPE